MKFEKNGMFTVRYSDDVFIPVAAIEMATDTSCEDWREVTFINGSVFVRTDGLDHIGSSIVQHRYADHCYEIHSVEYDSDEDFTGVRSDTTRANF